MIHFPHKTAISSKIASRPLRDFIDYMPKGYGIKTVLDFGCGKQRDKKLCLERFGSYTPYDPYYAPDKSVLDKKYNLVLCIYVLNVLPPKEREQVFRKINVFLMRRSLVVVAIRTRVPKAVLNWEAYEDGFITTRKTFQAFISSLELYVRFKSMWKTYWVNDINTFLLIPMLSDAYRSKNGF